MSVTWGVEDTLISIDNQYAFVRAGVGNDGRVWMFTYVGDAWPDGFYIKLSLMSGSGGSNQVTNVELRFDEDCFDTFADAETIAHEAQQAMLADPEGFDPERFDICPLDHE